MNLQLSCTFNRSCQECCNNIGSLLPTKDTTILVKKYEKKIINDTLRRRVSAVNGHHQAKVEQRSGTWSVCTLWDPISFIIAVH
jgi:hypothetical protein